MPGGSGDTSAEAADPDGDPPVLMVGKEGLVIYKPDDDDLTSSQRRAVGGALALAVPAVFAAIDTLL